MKNKSLLLFFFYFFCSNNLLCMNKKLKKIDTKYQKKKLNPNNKIITSPEDYIEHNKRNNNSIKITSLENKKKLPKIIWIKNHFTNNPDQKEIKTLKEQLKKIKK